MRPQKPLLDLAFCIYLVRENSGEKTVKVNKGPASNNVLFFFQVVFAVYGTLFGIVGLFKLRSKSKKESPEK